jgi:uncharacterized protein YcbX
MGDRPKLTAARVQQLAAATDRIRSLDETTRWLANDLEDSDDTTRWGEKVRDIFGRNRLSQWRNEFLGQAVACAIINELMQQRAEIVQEVGDDVECPPPPMPLQHPDRENR